MIKYKHYINVHVQKPFSGVSIENAAFDNSNEKSDPAEASDIVITKQFRFFEIKALYIFQFQCNFTDIK